MSRAKKQTWKRQLVAIGCKTDFGLGTGVIAEETVVYRDNRGNGFNTPLFAARMMDDDNEMMKRYVKVVSKMVRPVVKKGKRA